MPVGPPCLAPAFRQTKQAAIESTQNLSATGRNRPLAVIIMGNASRKSPLPGTLYDGLQHHLESRGYRVTRDPGLPYTTPDESAEVWVGHSRGSDRLRFAPPGVTTISVGSNRAESVNHPGDVVDLPSPDAYDELPAHVRQAHMDWHPSMVTMLDRQLIRPALVDAQTKQAAPERGGYHRDILSQLLAYKLSQHHIVKKPKQEPIQFPGTAKAAAILAHLLS